MGKKHYTDKNYDHVILESPASEKFIKRDKLDISDIEGTKPIPKIEAVDNITRHYRNMQSSSADTRMRRVKTEGEDSLDTLIKNSK